jgi:hypothetical protein
VTSPGKIVLSCALVALAACTQAATSSVVPRPTEPLPAGLAKAEELWRDAGIEDYTLGLRVTDCMLCGNPHRFSVTVTGGAVTERRATPSDLKDRAPTVEDLFSIIEKEGPDGTKVVYNRVGVPIRVHVDTRRWSTKKPTTGSPFTGPDPGAVCHPGRRGTSCSWEITDSSMAPS